MQVQFLRAAVIADHIQVPQLFPFRSKAQDPLGCLQKQLSSGLASSQVT